MPATSRKTHLLALVAVLCVVLLGTLYIGRHQIKDAWAAWRAPKLPPATAYAPGPDGTVANGQDVTSPFEPGYSTSEHYTLETSPGTKPVQKDPLAFTGTLPAEANLAVPFTTQAPFSNWDYPYQEACEEASSIMVDAYYKGKTGQIPAADAQKEILDIVAYEKSTLGFYEDTNATQTAQFIKGFFGYDNVIVKPLTSPDDIKQAVALGYPVIVPFAGKLLGNPNFRNGGPPYHMLVIRGYTPKLFITNDPGTRNGLQYTYTYDTVMNAAHEWVGDAASITKGKKMMIVVIPNKK